MGYDVTFHPVSQADLQHFVFDVVNTPPLAKKRAQEISRDKAKQRFLMEGIFGRLPQFMLELTLGPPSEDDLPLSFGESIAFAAAAVAGHLHPYWYARGAALSFLADKHPEVARLFTPLQKIAEGDVAKVKLKGQGLLGSNYSASGFIAPRNLPKLTRLLDELATRKPRTKVAPLFKVFDEQGLDSLRRAIAYASANGLGLMEASDLVVPMGQASTDTDNLRAHFLDNVDHAAPGRMARRAKAKKAARKPARKA